MGLDDTKFQIYFSFEVEEPKIDVHLKVLWWNIFTIEDPIMLKNKPLCPKHKNSQEVQEFMECYNVVDLGEDDGDIRNI